jgi:phage tail protein X
MAEPRVNTTTLQGIAAASAAPVVADTTNAEVAAGLKALTNLGIGEALLNDPIYGPELKKVFELYKINKTAAVDALFKTKFGKLDSDARTRYVTKIENSDLYKEGVKSWLIGIKKRLKQQGSTLSDQKLEDYYIRGIDDATILDEALSGGKFEVGKTGGTQADYYNALLRTATANGISTSLLPKVLGFDSIDQVVKELQTGASLDDFNQKIRNYAKVAMPDWAKKLIDQVVKELQTGASLDDFNQKIRNYAKVAMPDWAKKLIDQGQDVTDIINPYRATIADELELPYNSIDVTDSTIQSALSANMGLADLRKQLRQDSRWQYTDKAKESVSNAALKVLRDFGFQG